MRSRKLVLVCLIVASALGADPVRAIPISWIAPGSGVFQNAANWDPNQIPATGDDVFFQNGTSPTVTFTASVTTSSLTIGTGDVTFSLDPNTAYIAGTVDIGGGLGPLGAGALLTPSVSLAVNNGTFNVGGLVSVHSDAALKGNGTVNVNQIVIEPGGQLRGALVINTTSPGASDVLNSGAVAPGDSPGTIIINGDYQQTIEGALEIEVGGLNPGTQHDVLIVTGAASLAGRLDLPIIGGFTPLAGNSIFFLQASNINGSFDFITAPNLPVAGPAVQIVQLPVGMAANFVNPTTKTFSNGPGPHSWGNVNTWGGAVPTTTDIVTIANSNPFPQRIDLDLSSTASARGFAHSVILSGATDPMTISVHEGTALSAISSVTVGALGQLELASGTVLTNLVQVNPSGTLSGAGRIVGDVVIGNDGMTGEATLDPDSSLGAIHIEQDLTLNSDAALQVMIQDPQSFDRVLVDQSTTLGGRLVMDASNYSAPVGTQFSIMLTNQFNGHFDSVETVGGESIFFAPPLGAPLAALGSESYTVQSYSIGDMNFDNSVDPNDAPHFVMGLLDPLQYWTTHNYVFPIQAGNFYAGSAFDFDDIQGFADAVGSLSAAQIYELITNYSLPEPATGTLLLMALGGLGSTRFRRPVR